MTEAVKNKRFVARQEWLFDCQSFFFSFFFFRVQAQRFGKTKQAPTAWLKVVWEPYVDAQVQSLLGCNTAIILPCQGLITLAPLPQSISVWRTRLAGFWQLLSGWVNLLLSMPARSGGGRGRALRRTQQVGLQPLLWQDNKRIYLLGGQDFRACVSISPSCPLTVFSVKYLQGKARFFLPWMRFCNGQFVDRHNFWINYQQFG